MDTKLDALDKLIAAVEAGDESWVHLPRISALHTDLVWKAYEGSLDAALALHNALLPGWIFVVGSHVSGVWISTEPESHTAENDSPARSWLLAILRAYRAQVAG